MRRSSGRQHLYLIRGWTGKWVQLAHARELASFDVRRGGGDDLAEAKDVQAVHAEHETPPRQQRKTGPVEKVDQLLQREAVDLSRAHPALALIGIPRPAKP